MGWKSIRLKVYWKANEYLIHCLDLKLTEMLKTRLVSEYLLNTVNSITVTATLTGESFVKPRWLAVEVQ